MLWKFGIRIFYIVRIFYCKSIYTSLPFLPCLPSLNHPARLVLCCCLAIWNEMSILASPLAALGKHYQHTTTHHHRSTHAGILCLFYFFCCTIIIHWTKKWSKQLQFLRQECVIVAVVTYLIFYLKSAYLWNCQKVKLFWALYAFEVSRKFVFQFR